MMRLPLSCGLQPPILRVPGERGTAVAAASKQLLPAAAMKATGTALHQSLVSPLGPVASSFPGYSRHQREYTVGAAASWEIDLSGGLRRGKAAAADEL
jgi:outer membrane protein TolC